MVGGSQSSSKGVNLAIVGDTSAATECHTCDAGVLPFPSPIGLSLLVEGYAIEKMLPSVKQQTELMMPYHISHTHSNLQAHFSLLFLNLQTPCSYVPYSKLAQVFY